MIVVQAVSLFLEIPPSPSGSEVRCDMSAIYSKWRRRIPIRKDYPKKIVRGIVKNKIGMSIMMIMIGRMIIIKGMRSQMTGE